MGVARGGNHEAADAGHRPDDEPAVRRERREPAEDLAHPGLGDRVYEAFTERIPKMGMWVEVILEPVPDKKDDKKPEEKSEEKKSSDKSDE